MALIRCPECGNQISNSAISCPHCGFQITCPECGRKHESVELPIEVSRSERYNRLILSFNRLIRGLIVLLLVLTAGLLWFAFKPAPEKVPPIAQAFAPSKPGAQSLTPNNAEPTPVVTSPPPALAPTAVPPRPQVILRLAGCKTMGTKLVPALAEAFLKQEGAKEVRQIASKIPGDRIIEEIPDPGRTSAKAIEIAAYSSSFAFDSLTAGHADIGMSSRRIKPDEAQKLRIFDDMTMPYNEHVLALDGIAIIVHPSNPVSALSKDQIAAIFSGMIGNWRQLKGTPGKINVYACNDDWGTADTFRSLVLGNAQLAASVQRFAEEAQLSDAVVNDPNSIGFVAIPYVKNARALAISEPGISALAPDRLTAGMEDYPLSRRLYFYTREYPSNPYTRKFIEFALSQAGQQLVHRQGFVALNAKSETTITSADVPPEYTKLTENALRLSLNFHFPLGSVTLEDESRLDLERIVEFLNELDTQGRSVMLFGFADSLGSPNLNLGLSRKRAQTVAEELKRHGISSMAVAGFGSSMPVASNETAEGRQQNRRVEIWLKQL